MQEPTQAARSISTMIDEKKEDTADDELAQAIRMSLEKAESPPKASSMSSAPTKKQLGASGPGSNPMWDPPRYIPAGDLSGPRTLGLLEVVELRDGGYKWQTARSFLDTGNQAMTLVDPAFAARHAIYRPDHAANGIGPRSSWGQAERWTTIRGVVPGASSQAPVVTIALKVRSQEFVIQAAISPTGGSHDVLLGTDVLSQLFAAGFRIGAGSI